MVVTEEAPAIEPSRTEISQVVDAQQIEALPISGRLFTDFILLTPGVAIRSRHRRIVRSHTPTISAAAHQVIFFAIAFNNTSCTFIIRSISEAEYRWASSTTQRYPPPLLRTHHVLTRPDNSHTTDTSAVATSFRSRVVLYRTASSAALSEEAKPSDKRAK
jgi:hypothetical protein